MATSKKKIKEIESIFIMPEIINEYMGSKDKEGNLSVFTDDRPENWTNNDRLIFDMLTALEHKIKAKVLDILT